MLGGVEFFYRTTTTGYVLLPRDSIALNQLGKSSNTLFFGCWNCNNFDEVYLSYFNGTLEIRNQNVNSSDIAYGLFIDAVQTLLDKKVEDRLSNCHWDKLCLIPGRPGEFIFLHGISKSILYSSVSINDSLVTSGMRNASSNRDLDRLPSQANHVLEFITHNCRITAMEVSPDGGLLASGDESGNCKITLLDIKKQGLFSRDVFNSVGHQTRPDFGYDLRRTISVHPDHSVLVVHWVSADLGGELNMVYYLATGSHDGCIRLWCVDISPNDSNTSTVAGNPLPVLQKLTMVVTLTHELPVAVNASVLCIQSLRDTNSSLVVSAGTNTGLIYFWELPMNGTSQSNVDFRQDVDVPDEAPRLASLLSCSLHPVVYVTMCLLVDNAHNRAGVRIVVAASDTQGAVRLYSQLTPRLTHEPPDESGETPLLALGFLGEATFQSPVVQCAFPPYGRPVPSELSRLLVCCADGTVHIYPTEELLTINTRLPPVTLGQPSRDFHTEISDDGTVEARKAATGASQEGGGEVSSSRLVRGRAQGRFHSSERRPSYGGDSENGGGPEPVWPVRSLERISGRDRSAALPASGSVLEWKGEGEGEGGLEEPRFFLPPSPTPLPPPFPPAQQQRQRSLQGAPSDHHQTQNPPDQPRGGGSSSGELPVRAALKREADHSGERRHIANGFIEAVAGEADRGEGRYSDDEARGSSGDGDYPSGFFPPASALADPQLNSTEILLNYVRRLRTNPAYSAQTQESGVTESRDGDEVEDTDSQADRVEAARIALAEERRGNRYSSLPKLSPSNGADQQSGSRRQSGKVAESKQVDADWLRQRRTGGPLWQDIKVLKPEDPRISLKVSRSPVAATTDGSRGNSRDRGREQSGSGREGPVEGAGFRNWGLESEMDPVTLQRKYTMRVDAEEIFGSLGTFFEGPSSRGGGGSSTDSLRWELQSYDDFRRMLI